MSLAAWLRQHQWSLAVIFLVGGLNFLASNYLKLYGRLELADVDRLMTGVESRRSNDILLVTITEQDYQNVFHRRSPLAQKRVEQLIEAILSAHPKVLGIDLDSEDWTHANPAMAYPRIVWAQDAAGGDWSGDTPVSLAPVAGGLAGARGALALALPDGDGRVRRHLRAVQLESGGFAWTLPGALANQHAPTAKDAADRPLLRFTGRRHQFPQMSSGMVMEAAGRCWEGDTSCQPAKPSELLRQLRDKYVLMGGTYRAARDRFPTPDGVKDGVEILAHAVESERSGFLGEVSPWVGFLVDLVMALSLYLLLHKLGLPFYFSLVAGVALGFAMSLLWSRMLFQSFGVFASFFPAVGGAVMGLVADLVQELKKTRRELAKVISARA